MTQSNDDKFSNKKGATITIESQQMEEKLRMKEEHMKPLPPEKDRRSLQNRVLNFQVGAIKKNSLGKKIINFLENLGEKITPLGNYLPDKLKPESEEQKMINNYNNKPDFLKTHRTPNGKTPSYRNLDPKTLEEINSAGRELLSAKKTPSNPPRSSSRDGKDIISR